jgi:hypothetical protein
VPLLVLQRSSTALTLLAVVALGAVACGGTTSSSAPRRVNKAQVELQLTLKAKEQSPRLTIGKATCPSDVTARTGVTFECSVQIEGQAVRYDVTISDILGSQAQYEFKPVQAIIDLSTVVDFIRSRLDEHWRTATIDCGRAKFRLAEVGATIDCTVFDGASTRYIQAFVENSDGTISLGER